MRGVYSFLFLRRRRQERRRVLRAGIVRGGLPPASVLPAAPVRFGEGDGQGERVPVPVPQPASARPAARARGGHCSGRVAASICVAGGACACLGRRRVLEAFTCFCSSSGIGKTGDAYSMPASVRAGCRRRGYGRGRLSVFGGRAGEGGEERWVARRRRWRDRRRCLVRGGDRVCLCVAAGVRAPTCAGGVAPVGGVCARITSVAGSAGDPKMCCTFFVGCAVHRSKKKCIAQRRKKNLWHATEQSIYISNTTGTHNGHRPHRTPRQHSWRRPLPCCCAWAPRTPHRRLPR